jgi:hypothetical protein
VGTYRVSIVFAGRRWNWHLRWPWGVLEMDASGLRVSSPVPWIRARRVGKSEVREVLLRSSFFGGIYVTVRSDRGQLSGICIIPMGTGEGLRRELVRLGYPVRSEKLGPTLNPPVY